MMVYHGTSLSNWKKISKTGILPRTLTKKANWTGALASQENGVYLTSGYAVNYASHAAAKKNDKLVLIEVDLDSIPGAIVVADEDALEQATRGGEDGLPRAWKGEQRVAHYRSMVRAYANKGMGFNWSMEKMGTGVHLGPIPVEAITRAVIIDPVLEIRLMQICLDASVTVPNHMIYGEYWKTITQEIFLGKSDGGLWHPHDGTGLTMIIPPMGAGLKVVQVRPEPISDAITEGSTVIVGLEKEESNVQL
jgi:hypothetical protein